jgi:hypothetical protein
VSAALVCVCTDPRLDHAVIRVQVEQRLQRRQLQAEFIFILNEPGGNVGGNVRSAIELLRRRQDSVVFAAVLHHDDCLAADAGLRLPLETSVQRLAATLAEAGMPQIVASGSILTATSAISWSDEGRRGHERIAFRMPRLSGLPRR